MRLTHSAYLPHTIQVWGLVIVYSFQGFVRASCQINGSQLHTFFFYITRWGLASGKNQTIRDEKDEEDDLQRTCCGVLLYAGGAGFCHKWRSVT